MRIRVGLLGMLLVLMVSACSAGAEPQPSDGPCFGAAALAAPQGTCPGETRSGPLTPDLSQASLDRSNAYGYVTGTKGCIATLPSFHLRSCTFGNPDADFSVALLGNSHAAQWLPAVEVIAEQENWRVTSYLASQCALADVRQGFTPAASSKACSDWGRAVTKEVAQGDFDLVIMSNKISRGVRGLTLAESAVRFEAGYAEVLRPFERADVPVIGIRDTPSPGFDVPKCLAAHLDDYSQCDGTRADWLPREPLVQAAAAVPGERNTVVDLTDYICAGEKCSAVVGGVPVYFDVSHLTATYAKTLAPYLRTAIKDALQR